MRGSDSSLYLAIETVFYPGVPGGDLGRGPPTQETDGESSPHFSFSWVTPISRFCCLWWFYLVTLTN